MTRANDRRMVGLVGRAAVGGFCLFCGSALWVQGCGNDQRPAPVLSSSSFEAGPGDAGGGPETSDAPHDATGAADALEGGAIVLEAGPEGNGPPVCGPKVPFTVNGGSGGLDWGPDVAAPEGGAATCGTGINYACSGSPYEIVCECPSAQCTCSNNGLPVGTPQPYAGCPSCDVPDFGVIAAACGAPY